MIKENLLKGEGNLIVAANDASIAFFIEKEIC